MYPARPVVRLAKKGICWESHNSPVLFLRDECGVVRCGGQEPITESPNSDISDIVKVQAISKPGLPHAALGIVT